MRLPIRVLLPAAALTCALLTGCERQYTEDSFNTATPAYAAAHPKTAEDRAGAVAPPVMTYAYPGASSGPGTASYVPKTTEPSVIAFVHDELDRVNKLIQDGSLDRAAKTLDGLDLRRSSWSTATQTALAPDLNNARKSLDAALQAKS